MAKWIPDNLNHGQLENVFFVLAGLMAVNIVAFLRLSASFDYRAHLFSEPLDESPHAFHRTADDQSYTEALQRDLRLSGNGALDFLEPGVLLGGRRSASHSASSKRSTQRTTTNSEHLETLLEPQGDRGFAHVAASI